MKDANAVQTLSSAVIAALQQGNKIEAIKLLREERKIGLKEAKDAVEEYVRSQPMLQASFAAAQTEAKRGALLWLAVLLAVGYLIYYFVRP